MKNRYRNFDNLRAVAIVGVILIHVTAPLAINGNIWGGLFNQISRFSVPVFFFLSGWGLTISDSFYKSESYIEFLKKRLTKILPIYVIWSLIYFVYKNIFKIYENLEMYSIMDFFKGLLLGTNYGHLYFIPLIIVLYILYPVLLKIGRNIYGVLLSFIITIISQLGHLVVGIPILGLSQNIFNWIFYFVFGIWIATNFEENIKKTIKYKSRIIFFSVLSLFMVVVGPLVINGYEDYLILTSMRPSVIFYTIFVVLMMMIYPVYSFAERIIEKISKYSYELYLSHYIFINILYSIYERIKIEILSVLHVLIILILILLLSYPAAKLSKKISDLISR